MRLLQVCDSREYILGNCFGVQLHATLVDAFQTVDLVPYNELYRIDVNSYDFILLTLKLRTFPREIELLVATLASTPVWVYEQDPWESYADIASIPGTYELIRDRLNVQSFLNTSLWWSEFIRAQGVKSKFVKMWVHPKLCREHSWESKTIELGFMGTPHPHRIVTFRALANLGCAVTVLPSQQYHEFLEVVASMKFFIHDESEGWTIKGDPIGRNALWGKEVEVASQGTFVLRNYEDEVHAYGLHENPLVLTYNSLSEIPGIIQRIQAHSPEELNAMIRDGVRQIRDNVGWMTVPEAMIDG